MVYNQMGLIRTIPKVSIEKMDKRFNGSHLGFEFLVDFAAGATTEYREMRQWCWETLGPSCELDAMNGQDNFAWGWIRDNYRTRILLRSEKELAWFKLRWE